jgi:hypothetical protein
MMSCVLMNWLGCAASDGRTGLVELPFGPWHATQSDAFFSAEDASAAATDVASA